MAKKKMPKDNDPTSLAARAERDAINDGNGGGGGCMSHQDINCKSNKRYNCCAG